MKPSISWPIESEPTRARGIIVKYLGEMFMQVFLGKKSEQLGWVLI